MAVVNSEQEADILRSLYFDYGPAKLSLENRAFDYTEGTTEWFIGETTEGATEEPRTTPKPEPANASVHIGFHDIFIEGEYLTVRSK